MRTIAGVALAVVAQPLAAQAPLPEPVRAMVARAAESGDTAKIDAVVAVAKETHPEAAGEIDRIVAEIAARRAAERTAALRQAGFLENWSGRIDIGGSLQTGNADTRNLALGLNLVKDGLRWRHRLEASADIQRSNGVTDQERILAAWQSDWQVADRLYLFGRFGFERNFDAGIRRRFVESAGLGWRAIRRETLSWDLEGGPALQQTRYFDGTRDDGFAFRGASRFGWTFAPETRLTNDSFLLVTSASSVINTLAVSTRLWKALSAGVSFTVQWEEEPAPGLQSTSTVTRVTLGWDF